VTYERLYGDFEGGQRVITQFMMRITSHRWVLSVAMRFSTDQPDPR
jgi:hypothetical protein